VSFIVTLGIGAFWLVGAGFLLALGGAFGGVAGWMWSIGYLLVATLIVVALWPLPGRRAVAGTGIVISVVLGLLIAHQAPYTTSRVVQILDHQAKPAGSRLVATTTDNNCFGVCANVTRWYLVPTDGDVATKYGYALLASGYKHTAGSDTNQYAKGALTITLNEYPSVNTPGPLPVSVDTRVALPQYWAIPNQYAVAPVGFAYLVLDVWATQG
jgi:hypothetical protein